MYVRWKISNASISYEIYKNWCLQSDIPIGWTGIAWIVRESDNPIYMHSDPNHGRSLTLGIDSGNAPRSFFFILLFPSFIFWITHMSIERKWSTRASFESIEVRLDSPIFNTCRHVITCTCIWVFSSILCSRVGESLDKNSLFPLCPSFALFFLLLVVCVCVYIFWTLPRSTCIIDARLASETPGSSVKRLDNARRRRCRYMYKHEYRYACTLVHIRYLQWCSQRDEKGGRFRDGFLLQPPHLWVNELKRPVIALQSEEDCISSNPPFRDLSSLLRTFNQTLHKTYGSNVPWNIDHKSSSRYVRFIATVIFIRLPAVLS